MKKISKRAIVITVVICFVTLGFIAMNNDEHITWFFQKRFGKTTHLEFDQNATQITVENNEHHETICLDDPEEIGNIKGWLNSLEVVELKKPMLSSPYEGSITWISIGDDWIFFCGDDIIQVTHDSVDWNKTVYYVKNLEYPLHDEQSELMQFINSLEE